MTRPRPMKPARHITPEGFKKIAAEHERYIRGYLHFLATSPRVPENIRAEMRLWGPCRDEFTDTGGWPRQLYVREARRMVSDYVMTENNCRGTVKAEDPVGLGGQVPEGEEEQLLRLVQISRVQVNHVDVFSGSGSHGSSRLTFSRRGRRTVAPTGP